MTDDEIKARIEFINYLKGAVVELEKQIQQYSDKIRELDDSLPRLWYVESFGDNTPFGEIMFVGTENECSDYWSTHENADLRVGYWTAHNVQFWQHRGDKVQS